MDKKEKFQRGREAKQRRQARLSCHWKRDWIISGLGRGPGCVWKSKLALTSLSPCLLCKDNFLLVVWICRSSSPSQKVDLAAAKRVRNLWSSVIALDIWHERRRSHRRLPLPKGVKRWIELLPEWRPIESGDPYISYYILCANVSRLNRPISGLRQSSQR